MFGKLKSISDAENVSDQSSGYKERSFDTGKVFREHSDLVSSWEAIMNIYSETDKNEVLNKYHQFLSMDYSPTTSIVVTVASICSGTSFCS